MIKISVLLAAALALASASSNVALAANNQAPITRGQAIDQCRETPSNNGEHSFVSRKACVDRLLEEQK